ncbi:MAG: SDR family NAD(P)-dependent oxidoreductase, partial [Anaerolineae bacterium]
MGKLDTWFDVSGKVVAITGGGGVLCGVMSRGLAKAGARVAVLDISEKAAQAVTDEITAAGDDALAVHCDCLDRASIEAARERVLSAYGPLDALINGAGGNSPKATTS